MVIAAPGLAPPSNERGLAEPQAALLRRLVVEAGAALAELELLRAQPSALQPGDWSGPAALAAAATAGRLRARLSTAVHDAARTETLAVRALALAESGG